MHSKIFLYLIFFALPFKIAVVQHPATKRLQDYNEVRCIVLRSLETFFSFSSPSIIFNANHNVTCPSSVAEYDFRLVKNSEGNGDGERVFFVEGRRQTLLYSCK